MKTPEKIKADMAKKIKLVTDSYLKDTPRKIRELREMRIPSAIERPLSKQDLADMTDVGPQNVGKIEKDYGETHSLNASIKFLIKVAVICDIDLNYLVGLKDQPERLSAKNTSSKPLSSQDDRLDILISLQRETLEVLKEKA
jgi:transcriptional regulator with XRE-family HTH domain